MSDCNQRILARAKVYVNNTEIMFTLLPFSNSTYSYLYFNYGHSTEQITIIPEFPSLLILPLFMTATLLTVIVYRKKRIALDNRSIPRAW